MNNSIQVQTIPNELQMLEEPLCLLPGESRQEFDTIRQMIIEDVSPKTNLEWLWTLDLAELSWEVIRYRRLREKILQAYRAKAIASILQRLDGAGIPAQRQNMVQMFSERTAAEWCHDPGTASEVDARLLRSGIDLAAINAEVFIQARESFVWFDTMLHSAQCRRIVLLREIAVRRESVKRSGNNWRTTSDQKTGTRGG